MDKLTEGERLVWAAAYGAEFARAVQSRVELGIPYSAAACVDHACAAVLEMRQARDRIMEGWGASDELSMLEEILSKPPPLATEATMRAGESE